MNPEDIGKFLEKYTYDYYIEEALSQVPDTIDKREGSIIYDALAPACYQLALFSMDLKNIMLDSFVQTATEGYLDLRAEEHGLKRIVATKSIVTGVFTDPDGKPYKQLVEGNRFSSIGENPAYYSVIQQVTDGNYTLMSESFGTVGNQYIGQLLPIDHFNGLGEGNLTEVTIPARDVETDDDLRARILKTYEVNQYGGNIEDYIQFTSKIDGVGAVQVYPIWKGGGTVRIVILSNSLDLPTNALLTNVQTVIDPTGDQKGYGIAPIGHEVTIAAPAVKTINVALHIDTEVGVTLDSIKNSIDAALKEHFLTIRKTWGNHDELYKYQQTIYRSQLMATLLKITGVANVSNVKLNGAEKDLVLVLDNGLQECAFLGTVSYQ
ncbi:baseplate J/gp47 family protein [Enterococcus timonensis]|uniref:baseplate J/gp47 family protein n=1 Tax=Enterococcus timonensis TaxID=1852364 RepID=UPI0008D9D17F|nr:baseplate J/gp47 family protein [Enterococcus timonensis]